MVVVDHMAAVDFTAVAVRTVAADSMVGAVFHMAVASVVEAAFIAVVVSVAVQGCMPAAAFGAVQALEGQRHSVVVLMVAVQLVSGVHIAARYAVV